jgi:hypothetical protein
MVLLLHRTVLDVLVGRHDSYTALTAEGRGKLGTMIGPRQILLEDQAHLPCLFSDAEQHPTHITHAAVCGLVLLRSKVATSGREWLEKRRIEHFVSNAPSPRGGALFVVTACERLNPLVPHDELILAGSNRPLSPNRKQGYRIVYLPAGMEDWFDEACGQWDALTGELPDWAAKR